MNDLALSCGSLTLGWVATAVLLGLERGKLVAWDHAGRGGYGEAYEIPRNTACLCRNLLELDKSVHAQSD
jgi:hypothetical protein